jgi:F-type H+-transporting ATPase subunit b
VHAFVAISESAKELLYPSWSELITGGIAFFILFAFMYKWVIPRVNQMLETRRQKIEGDLEKAEESRTEADKLLEDYRKQLGNARDEANRIIEEARKTADSMRRDLEGKAQEESRAIVDKAQEEIRAERDRVFQELKAQVGVLSLQLAERMVGQSLDKDRQLRMVDDYITELEAMPAANGNGNGNGSGTEG